jgi:hypothetical protein
VVTSLLEDLDAAWGRAEWAAVLRLLDQIVVGKDHRSLIESTGRYVAFATLAAALARRVRQTQADGAAPAAARRARGEAKSGWAVNTFRDTLRKLRIA